MFIYTVQRKDYDDYPTGNVIATVGPFDTRHAALRHGEATHPDYYITPIELKPPT